ncbi:hypothetical protein LEP1GSC170_3584 [Leptospira interrogans serovar Bataviae str. HAI135]|nr:hypothetical protein LEP1GSC170_3584 [Leptospira interrogans serovar Bataviae str. HAI135]
MGTTAYPLFYSETLKMWELLSLLIFRYKKLNIKCNSHKNDDFMQKFDWVGIYRDSQKNKTAKNNFLFAVLFKGTKKF